MKHFPMFCTILLSLVVLNKSRYTSAKSFKKIVSLYSQMHSKENKSELFRPNEEKPLILSSNVNSGGTDILNIVNNLEGYANRNVKIIKAVCNSSNLDLKDKVKNEMKVTKGQGVLFKNSSIKSHKNEEVVGGNEDVEKEACFGNFKIFSNKSSFCGIKGKGKISSSYGKSTMKKLPNVNNSKNNLYFLDHYNQLRSKRSVNLTGIRNLLPTNLDFSEIFKNFKDNIDSQFCSIKSMDQSSHCGASRSAASNKKIYKVLQNISKELENFINVFGNISSIKINTHEFMGITPIRNQKGYENITGNEENNLIDTNKLINYIQLHKPQVENYLLASFREFLNGMGNDKYETESNLEQGTNHNVIFSKLCDYMLRYTIDGLLQELIHKSNKELFNQNFLKEPHKLNQNYNHKITTFSDKRSGYGRGNNLTKEFIKINFSKQLSTPAVLEKHREIFNNKFRAYARKHKSLMKGKEEYSNLKDHVDVEHDDADTHLKNYNKIDEDFRSAAIRQKIGYTKVTDPIQNLFLANNDKNNLLQLVSSYLFSKTKQNRVDASNDLIKDYDISSRFKNSGIKHKDNLIFTLINKEIKPINHNVGFLENQSREPFFKKLEEKQANFHDMNDNFESFNGPDSNKNSCKNKQLTSNYKKGKKENEKLLELQHLLKLPKIKMAYADKIPVILSNSSNEFQSFIVTSSSSEEIPLLKLHNCNRKMDDRNLVGRNLNDLPDKNNCTVTKTCEKCTCSPKLKESQATQDIYQVTDIASNKIHASHLKIFGVVYEIEKNAIKSSKISINETQAMIEESVKNFPILKSPEIISFIPNKNVSLSDAIETPATTVNCENSN